jgi:hypothetical protein
MKTYMLALGWWNFIGCFMMLGFFNEAFGRKVFNEWTKIMAVPFTLDFWSRFWMGWAIGLNFFYAGINLMAANWEFLPLMKFTVICDIVAYVFFMGLSIWGLAKKRLGAGGYSVFIVFGVWLGWGIWSLLQA